MKEYLNQLNHSQKEAVTTNAQYTRVIAGAGSGKTKVLTLRIVYLIEEMGISPQSILAITFTNKAAQEMKSRVDTQLADGTRRPLICTFHAFCVRFLREEIKNIGYPNSFVILDDEDQEKLIKQLLADADISKEILAPKAVRAYISNNKSSNIGVEYAASLAGAYGNETLKAQMYEAYEKQLARLQALDFDDLLVKTCTILSKFPAIQQKWTNRYQNLLVDEFQDTNDIQYRLIQLMMRSDSTLLVVGDPDQTIYTWRGADVNLILNFEKDYKGAAQIILDENYRSTKSILDVANALIHNNRKRIHKDLKTQNGDGGKIIYYQGKTPELESAWVSERIKELLNQNKKIRYQDIAILYRSNYYSREVEAQLVKQRIPYVIYGGIRFFERREVKDALAYLRLVVNPKDDLAFDRVINTPKRGIGNKSLETIRESAANQNQSKYEYILGNLDEFKRNALQLHSFVGIIENAKTQLKEENAVFSKILESILEQSGYIDSLKSEEEEDRIENLTELVNLLFIKQGEGVESVTLDEILQDIALFSAQDEMSDSDRVMLMTIHTAKGLEFPYVFVVGLSEGVFPSAKTLLEAKDGLEEERRLAYVAFTRAMKQLFLSDAGGYNYTSQSYRVPSRFINEVSDFIKPYYGGTNIASPTSASTTVNVHEYREAPILGDRNFHPGQMVEHRAFGEGIIIAIEKDCLRVAFKNPGVGTKIIASAFPGITAK